MLLAASQQAVQPPRRPRPAVLSLVLSVVAVLLAAGALVVLSLRALELVGWVDPPEDRVALALGTAEGDALAVLLVGRNRHQQGAMPSPNSLVGTADPTPTPALMLGRSDSPPPLTPPPPPSSPSAT